MRPCEEILDPLLIAGAHVLFWESLDLPEFVHELIQRML